MLRPRLWRYLSGAAVVGHEAAVLPDLPELSRADLVRIFATHLALRPETDSALAAAERALKELPASQAMTRV